MTITHTTSTTRTATTTRKLRSRAVLLVAVTAVAASCSGGGKESSNITVRTVAPTTATSTTVVPTTTTTVATGVSVAAPTVAAVFTESPAGEEGKLDPGLQAQILDTVTKYVQLAITAPLQGATAPVAVGQFLTVHAAGALTAERRAVLTDEGVPPLQSGQATTNNITITGLVGTDSQMGIVNAHLDLVITGTVGGTAASIKRAGDLTLVPDNGAWRIDAFDMSVERDLP